MYMLSPRKVIKAILHAAELPAEAFEGDRMLTLPGITVSVQESAAVSLVLIFIMMLLLFAQAAAVNRAQDHGRAA